MGFHILGFDPAVVCHHDLLNKGKAETGAARFSREKGVKDFRQFAYRNTRAVVLYDNADAVGIPLGVFLQGNGDPALHTGSLRCGLNRVQQQVQEHLTHQRRVTSDDRTHPGRSDEFIVTRT